MAENFNLIFGSQAPATATWTDADYQTGWSTVGSTPPTAEQFDFLQNRADLKAKELNDALTPLVQKSEADGRQAGTIYAAGACVTVDGLPNGWLLECVVAGTSGTVVITLPDPLIDGATITDGTVTWALRKVATNGGLGYRQPNETVTAGTIRYHSALPTGYYLECTTAGTTSAGEITPSSTIGDTVTDGTVVWTISRDLGLFGGQMTSSTTISRNVSNSYNILTGGRYRNDGAELVIAGKDVSGNDSGTIYMKATDGTKLSVLQLYKDGNLKINNNDLGGSAIVAKSLGQTGYIKYASGLIIQWVNFSGNVAANSDSRITFPISFSNTSYSVSAIFMSNSIGYPGLMVNSTAGLLTNTYVTIRNSSAYIGNIKVIAIGY